jgi:hypothetical protein
MGSCLTRNKPIKTKVSINIRSTSSFGQPTTNTPFQTTLTHIREESCEMVRESSSNQSDRFDSSDSGRKSTQDAEKLIIR